MEQPFHWQFHYKKDLEYLQKLFRFALDNYIFQPTPVVKELLR